MKTTLNPIRLRDKKPENGETVIWIWSLAGQIVAGDFYNGKLRDAAKNYEIIKGILPDYWCKWPSDWP